MVAALSMESTISEARPLIAKSKISRKDAEDNLISLVKKKHFNPKDFAVTDHLNKIKGIYVPIWIFEVSAKSPWRGEYSQTHYRTVTKSRLESTPKGHVYVDYVDSEPYDVWFPIHGTHEKDYRLLVSASDYITEAEIEKNWPFKTSELQTYDATHLAEWDVEEAKLNYADAIDICNRRIGDLEYNECKKLVERLNNYNPQSTFNFSSLVLFPIYSLNYTHRDKPYSNLINGLTGNIQGNIPSIRNNIILTASVVLVALVVALMALQRLLS